LALATGAFFFTEAHRHAAGVTNLEWAIRNVLYLLSALIVTFGLIIMILGAVMFVFGGKGQKFKK